MRKPLTLVVAMLILVSVACQGKTTGADDLVASARAHLEAGEYEDAIADLEAAVKADPGSSWMRGAPCSLP